MRIRLTIAYLGTGYSGWQAQANKPTVQGELETALGKLYGVPVAATASGRTDEGVHALGQVVHFDAPKDLPCPRIVGALNFFLPPQIRVIAAQTAPDDFNARKSAHRKTYEYRFYLAERDSPFLLGRALRLPPSCDMRAMADAAPLFVGKHDFTAFRNLGSSAKTTVRTVFDCRLTPAAGEWDYALTVTADGFLYKMVRNIAGTLVRVGEGTLPPQEIPRLLATGEEWPCKCPAPPCGLYLKNVEY